MRVHAAATGADHRAVLAGGAEVGDPVLPRGDAGMLQGGVKGVREYVKPGRAGAPSYATLSESACS